MQPFNYLTSLLSLAVFLSIVQSRAIRNETTWDSHSHDLQARAWVTEPGAEKHLCLLSSPLDYSNPNSGKYEYDNEAQGQGVSIVVIDTGFEYEALPQHFGTEPGNPRPLGTWSVPAEIRNPPMPDDQKAKGWRYTPDDMKDYAHPDPDTGKPAGHGTGMAILAAGLQNGVARKAGLYLIKAGYAIWDKKNKIVEDGFTTDAALTALMYVRDCLADGTLKPGKTVVLYTLSGNIDAITKTKGLPYYNWYHKQMKAVLQDLDSKGAVLVFSAGNGGIEDPFEPTTDYIPQTMAYADTPYVLVGSVNANGQLARHTSPGTTDVPLTVYAQGLNVRVWDVGMGDYAIDGGTSPAAAIAAGQVANFMNHPLFPTQFQYDPSDPPENSVGQRMKKWLRGPLAYQRVADGNKLDEPAQNYKYTVPENIPTIYNFIHGPQ
ncbi:hypothetical protein NKR23_g9477 [Pleurostoma richardsiae]|uniref:Peptidase S8/S53 domain-containing protein n=1 Tax=Pleurostoma richardsiae TaxID=41990 RepID=A0AA38R6Q8_9PEZI|nr:hypothetical protein NKR23_g9477 [Pleurostoma richardsiae]